MNSSVPLLNPEQIQELNNMVTSISMENNKKLEELIGQQIQIENATIMQLYNITVEEWSKKQKIIDNLCHFSLTMMATVEYLWGQKDFNEQRIGHAEAFISDLNRHITELGDQNQHFKRQISEAQIHMEQIAVQKQKIEELYKSQSCINFIHQQSPENQQQGLLQKLQEQNCCDHQRLLQEEKEQLIGESLKLLDEKQLEMFSLRQENSQLSKKLSSLMEEHQLVKMEVELAQIAVKDALSYKESSILDSSRSQFSNMHDEIYTTKSHAQFMNGQLECFSNFNESFREETKNTLLNDLPEVDNFKCKTEPSLPFLSQSFMSQSNLAKETTEDVTAAENPFKKKASSKVSQLSSSNVLKDSMLSCPRFQDELKKEPRVNAKNKKTVSLQCNLVKGLEKISFDYKKNLYQEEYKLKIKPFAPVQNKKGTLPKPKKEPKSSDAAKLISKSQILKPLPSAAIQKVQVLEKIPQEKEGNSINKLYNFFSSKVISKRIKIK